MSALDTQSTAVPEQLVHRRTVVTGIRYDASLEANRDAIVRWVLTQGGMAMSRSTGALMVETDRGWVRVPDGHTVLRGVLGEFYPIGPGVRLQAYETPDEAGFGNMLTRAQAAAVVVDADELFDRVARDAGGQHRIDVAKLVESVHRLAATVEAFR